MKVETGTKLKCVRRKKLNGDGANYAKIELVKGKIYEVYIVLNYESQIAVSLKGCLYQHSIENFIIINPRR